MKQHALPHKGTYRTDMSPTLSIVDSNPMLITLCKTLESTFRHGAIHEDKRNKFELIDLLLHITRKQNSGCYLDKIFSKHPSNVVSPFSIFSTT